MWSHWDHIAALWGSHYELKLRFILVPWIMQLQEINEGNKKNNFPNWEFWLNLRRWSRIYIVFANGFSLSIIVIEFCHLVFTARQFPQMHRCFELHFLTVKSRKKWKFQIDNLDWNISKPLSLIRIIRFAINFN